ncbi:MAG: hypothetical protein KDC80_30315 [Saprospiraceae bacterium]|nr:hypothetical protein [Saprospiraceae bacterium]
MKTNFCVVFLLFFFSSYSQELIYNLDTSAFTIIKNPADTVMTADDNIRFYKNFRVRGNIEKGYVQMGSGDNPNLVLVDGQLNQNVELWSNLNGSGAIRLYNYDVNGTEVSRISLITNYNGSQDARIITDELEIKGGSDLAELFEITNEKDRIKPGLLVALDPDSPGQLRISESAYDRNIAGVISGANGIKPGILMGQEGTLANGGDLVTISGRTYVQCNTLGGPIKIGDLLTSSPVPGEAMKAGKRRKSRGAVIGKAMSNLDQGSQYVLVLVNLQ